MSSSFRPFVAIFTLSAPLTHASAIHPPFLMLDGLLGYAVAQEQFGPQAYRRRAYREDFVDLVLPLDHVLPNVYAASQGFAPLARSGFAVLTSPYDHGVLDPFSVSPSARFAPSTTLLPTLTTPQMVFFGRGDIAAVTALLTRHIRFLGHKRGAGFGHVVHLEVLPVETDWSWSRWDADGVHFHRALPQQPPAIAAALEAQWGPEAAWWWQQHQAELPMSPLAVKPPYHWAGAQQPCYEPDHYGLAEAATFLEQWPGTPPWQVAPPPAGVSDPAYTEDEIETLLEADALVRDEEED